MKDTTNKQLSTTRTSVTRTTTQTKTTPKSPVTSAKVPPIKKSTAVTKTTITKSPGTKTETSKVEITEEITAQVHVNGNGVLENGKDDLVVDVVQQQDILIETSAPCLVAVDGNNMD